MIHPAAKLFPMMPDAELDKLAADIAKNGLQQPLVGLITRDGTQLIDGRNRAAAIARIADQQRREELQGQGLWQLLSGETDAYGYVMSANIRRRHLTPAQRRELIDRLLRAQPEKSDRQIANQVKASPTTVGVRRARLEAAGDVSKLDTRTDTKGRQQPASKPMSAETHKPASPPECKLGGGKCRYSGCAAQGRCLGGAHVAIRQDQPKAAPSKPEPAVSELPRETRKEIAEKRPDIITQVSALLVLDADRTLSDLVRVIGVASSSVETLPSQKRVAHVRGFQRALGVTDADLRPVT